MEFQMPCHIKRILTGDDFKTQLPINWEFRFFFFQLELVSRGLCLLYFFLNVFVCLFPFSVPLDGGLTKCFVV